MSNDQPDVPVVETPFECVLGPLPKPRWPARGGYDAAFDEEQMRAYARTAIAAERARCALIAGDNYGWVNGRYFDSLDEAILDPNVSGE